MNDEQRIYTLKEIADELKIDKQRVYRFVKQNHISEVHHEALHDVLHCEANLCKNGVKYYDRKAKQLILNAFCGVCESESASSTSDEVHHEALHDVLLKQCEKPCDVHKNNKEIEFLRQQILSMNEQIASRDAQIRQQGEVIISLNRELEKEREHNRDKDRQLMDTLSKLAETQAALAVGQSAEKQKALAETLIEGQQKMDSYSESAEYEDEGELEQEIPAPKISWLRQVWSAFTRK